MPGPIFWKEGTAHAQQFSLMLRSTLTDLSWQTEGQREGGGRVVVWLPRPYGKCVCVCVRMGCLLGWEEGWARVGDNSVIVPALAPVCVCVPGCEDDRPLPLLFPFAPASAFNPGSNFCYLMGVSCTSVLSARR